MDYSGSMPEDAITNMENGIKSFISLMGASDKCEIIKFAAGVHLEQTFTSNKDSLNAAVDRLYSYGDNGATNLFGSMHQGLNDLDSQTGMKALIAFTDGGENVYEYSQSQIISEAQSGGMPIYNIGLGDADASTLQYLADETGGRYFYAPTSEDLVNIYNMISGQLRGTYIFTWEGVYAPGYITSGTHVTLRVTTEYECGNGTIIDTTHNSYIAE